MNEKCPKLLKKIEIMSKYVHPNVIRFIESFWVKRTFSIIMEFENDISSREVFPKSE
jgi:hypothetical protein